MAKNFKSKQYTNHENQIKVVNDIYNGVDTAKDYLYQYSEEDKTEFGNRQNTADLDNYVASTVDAIKNIIFRKPINLSGVEDTTVQEYLEKINFTNSINEFAKTTLTNRIKEGYSYILVDSVQYDKEKVTNKAQQDALGIRPYFVNIKRSNVFRVVLDEQSNHDVVIISEAVEEWSEAELESKTIEQVRVLYRDGRVQLWRDDEVYKTFNTNQSEITIVKVGNDDIPPLYDLAKTNINLFNRESEKENYVRMGANPFIAIFGDLEQEDGEAVTLSINSGLKFSNKSESDAKWIEMSGANYEIIKDTIQEHRNKMQRISVEFTTEVSNRTATEVEKESTTAKSQLTHYATELEEGINTAIEMLSLYKDGITGENTALVNKDFESNILTDRQFNMLMQLHTNNTISRERLLSAVERGEILEVLSDDDKAKEELRLKNEGLL